MKRMTLLLLLAALIGGAAAQPRQTLTYLTRDTLDLRLDVYHPADPRPDGACVVYLFGGGFVSGTRDGSQATQAVRALLGKGFTTVSIDYRLYLSHAPRVPLLKTYTLFDTAITQAVEDCCAALAFLCRHAHELGIDTSRIVLTGNSAGAVTVLQADYARANRLPAAEALPEGFRPAAVVPYAGAIYCRNNALHYATPPAPTCFFHGMADRIVNYRRFRGSPGTSLFGADRVADVFRRGGYSYWILRYQDRGHEVASALPQTIDLFTAFVDATLSGHTMQYDARCTDSGIRPNDWTHKTIFDLYRQ